MSHGAAAKQRTRRTVRSSLSVGTRMKNSWVVVIRKASQLCQKDGREFLPLSFITSYKCILPTCHCRNCKCKRSGVATLRLGIKKLDLIANFLVLGMRSIATSVSVCLYVDCSRTSETTRANFMKFYMIVYRSFSDDNEMRFMCFRLVHHVIFHNWTNGNAQMMILTNQSQISNVFTRGLKLKLILLSTLAASRG